MRCREEFDGELEKLEARGHRALVAGVIRGDERVCRGWSAEGKARNALSLFEIGSITKVFTGVLLADMSLRGEVALEDPLSRHLPGPRPAWRHREPTLLELATHRSALPNTPKGMGRRELAYSLGIGGQDPWAEVTEVEYERLVTRESHGGLPADVFATRAWRSGYSAKRSARAPGCPTTSCSTGAS